MKADPNETAGEEIEDAGSEEPNEEAVAKSNKIELQMGRR